MKILRKYVHNLIVIQIQICEVITHLSLFVCVIAETLKILLESLLQQLVTKLIVDRSNKSTILLQDKNTIV